MIYRFSKFKNGFSIIELLISIFIMIIMIAVLFTGYRDNKAQDDVETVTRQIGAELRALQNEALSGKRIGSSVSNRVICDFVFSATATLNEYKIQYNSYPSSPSSLKECSASSVRETVGTARTISLNPSKKVKVAIRDTVTISFSSPFGKITTGNSKVAIISKIDPTKIASVCVCTSGIIYEQSNDSNCAC